jgi:hypothetical protein
MRNLTASVRKVIVDIKGFGVLFSLFLFTFANVFYVTYFYSESQAIEVEDDAGETITVPSRQNYAWYILYTFNMFFGNWDYATPVIPEFFWVNFMFFALTVLFTIMMFNVLIAMVEHSYESSCDSQENDDNKRQLILTCQAIEIKAFLQGFWKKKDKNEGTGACNDQRSSFIYIAFMKEEKELDDDEWDSFVFNQIDKLGNVESSMKRIDSVSERVDKMCSRIGSILKVTNTMMKKNQAEADAAEAEKRAAMLALRARDKAEADKQNALDAADRPGAVAGFNPNTFKGKNFF